jgi:hypothetical protein
MPLVFTSFGVDGNEEATRSTGHLSPRRLIPRDPHGGEQYLVRDPVPDPDQLSLKFRASKQLELSIFSLYPIRGP